MATSDDIELFSLDSSEHFKLTPPLEKDESDHCFTPTKFHYAVSGLITTPTQTTHVPWSKFIGLTLFIFIFPIIFPVMIHSIPTPTFDKGLWVNWFYVFLHVPTCMVFNAMTHSWWFAKPFGLHFRWSRIFWWVGFPWYIAYQITFILQAYIFFFPLPANCIVAYAPSVPVAFFGWWKMINKHIAEECPGTFTKREILVGYLRALISGHASLAYFAMHLVPWSIFKDPNTTIEEQYAIMVFFFFSQILIQRLCEYLTGHHIEFSESVMLYPLAFGSFYHSLTIINIGNSSVFALSCVLDFIKPFLIVTPELYSLKQKNTTEKKRTGLLAFLSIPYPSTPPKSPLLSKLPIDTLNSIRNVCIFLVVEMADVSAPIYCIVLFPLIYRGPNKANYYFSSFVTDEMLRTGFIYAAITFGVRLLAFVIILVYVRYHHFTIINYLLEILQREKHVFFCSIAVVALVALKFTLLQANVAILHLFIGRSSWEREHWWDLKS